MGVSVPPRASQRGALRPPRRRSPSIGGNTAASRGRHVFEAGCSAGPLDDLSYSSPGHIRPWRSWCRRARWESCFSQRSGWLPQGVVFNLVWITAPRGRGRAVPGTRLDRDCGAGELIAATSLPTLLCLVFSGLAYSAGALVYTTGRPNPAPATFGYHEVFHALTIVAAAMHFSAIASVVLPGFRPEADSLFGAFVLTRAAASRC